MDLLCNDTFCSSPRSNTTGLNLMMAGSFLYVFPPPNNAKMLPPFALVALCSLLVLSSFFSRAEPRCEPCQVPS